MHFWCLQLMGLLYFLKNENFSSLHWRMNSGYMMQCGTITTKGIVDTLTELWSCVALLLPLNNNVIGLFIMLLATQSDRWIRFMLKWIRRLAFLIWSEYSHSQRRLLKPHWQQTVLLLQQWLYSLTNSHHMERDHRAGVKL